MEKESRKRITAGMISSLNRIVVIAVVLWTAACAGSLAYHLYDSKLQSIYLAHETALESVEKDLLYRYWAAGHGGIYVPVTEATPPNPYLSNIKERDITTPSGRRLTLMNPAYMTRQVHELGRLFTNVQGHITSLKPLRPENKPDAWEAQALSAIQAGAREFGEVTDYQGQPHYRLMYPLYIVKTCLACHGEQGYNLDDLRGGISATIPMTAFTAVSRDHVMFEAKQYFAVWFLGIVGISLATPYVRRRINEQVIAVAEAEESVRRLRAIVGNAPFGAHLYTLEPDGRLIFTGANAAADRMLGLDNSMFIGKTIEAAFPALAGTDIPERYRQVASRGTLFERDQVEHEAGAIRGAYEIYAFQTAHRQMAVFFRDITERKRMEAALQESEERYRTIVDTSLEGIVVIDEQTVITFANIRMAEMLGRTREEMLGRSIFAFIPEDEREDHERQLALRRQGIATHYERKFTRKGGEAVWTRASASPLIDKQGAFNGAFGMYTDITEHREAVESLRRSDARLNEAQRIGKLGDWENDLATNTLSLSENTYEVLGVKPVTNGMPTMEDLFRRIHPEDRARFRDFLKEATDRSLTAWQYECRIVLDDGEERNIFVSARVEMNAQGRPTRYFGIVQDITERRRAENALQEYSRFNEQIIKSVDEGVVVYGPDLNYRTWNPFMERLSEKKAGEVLGRHPEEVFPFLKDVGVIDRLKNVLRGETAPVASFPFRLPSGRTGWASDACSPLKNARNEIIGVIGTVRDITDQKISEEQLRASENKYRHLFMSNPMPMFVYDAHSLAILAVNDFMVERYGYSREEFLRMTIKDIRPPEELPRLYAILAARTDKTEKSIIGIHRRKDGSSFDVEVTAHEITFEGKPARLILAVDITERKRTEEALRESEQSYRNQFAQNSAVMLLIDHADGSIIDANDAALRFYGYSRERMHSLRITDINTLPADKTRSAWESVAPNKGKLFEFRHRLSDGTLRDVEVSSSLIYFGERKVLHSIITDITERKLAVEQRKKLEEELLHSQKIESVGRLAGGIAHDINNMLTPILGYADMLALRMPEDDPSRADLKEIVGAADRVKDMTQQLLAFARKQTLDMRRLNANVVISAFGKMLRRTLPENILINLSLAPSVGTVLADERQLELVILNLAVNAHDAMPEGGVLKISTKDVVLDGSFVEARPELLPGRYLLIKVSDTGLGMDGDTLSRIFDPFFTTKESGRGTGLGLATVYGIIRQHKGYIDVVSEPRQGATFFIYLPITEDAVESEPRTEQACVRRGSETILVVEDQSEVLEIVQQLLKALGYRVLTAADGTAAREIMDAEAGTVDLLITDIIMPGINGRELYVGLKRTHPALKVIYMSGYPADVISTQGMLDSGVTFIRKPFSIQQLSEQVRQVLDGGGAG